MNRRKPSRWSSGMLAISGVLGAGLFGVSLLYLFVGGYILVALFWAVLAVAFITLGIGKGIQHIVSLLSPKRRALRTVETIPDHQEATGPMGGRFHILVAGVEGAPCPLGLETGKCFLITPTGQIAPRLCRPALEAIRPMLLTALETEHVLETACACPLRDRRVRFVVAPAELLAA
jgi:hypothetical protein